MAEFKSLAAILHEPREEPPAISPFIAEIPPPPEPDDPLVALRLDDRFDRALLRLLREIATEVVGRELLLGPVETQAIVERLRARYGISDEIAVETSAQGGDMTIVCASGTIDASLGRRLAAAIDRTAT